MRRILFIAALMMAGPAVAECSRCDEIVAAAEAKGFSGIVLVGRDGSIDFMHTSGLARSAPDLPNQMNTRFPTGSLAKWVASIVVMKLVERGQLALDAPIADYLPDYPHDAARRVTLRMLLSHSSGIPNDVDAAIKNDPATRALDLDDAEAIRRFASSPLAFEPGTQWDYSHANWIVLKGIVERVTARSYASLVRAFIVEPLGLQGSGTFSGMTRDVPGMASGFRDDAPFDRPQPSFFLMAGGYYTTAPDLLAVFDGLFSGKLLSPEGVRILMTVVRPPQSYALGGRTKVLDVAGTARAVAWEYGSDGAYRVLGWRVIADGHTVILMNNTSYDHEAIGDMAGRLLDASYR